MDDPFPLRYLAAALLLHAVAALGLSPPPLLQKAKLQPIRILPWHPPTTRPLLQDTGLAQVPPAPRPTQETTTTRSAQHLVDGHADAPEASRPQLPYNRRGQPEDGAEAAGLAKVAGGSPPAPTHKPHGQQGMVVEVAFEAAPLGGLAEASGRLQPLPQEGAPSAPKPTAAPTSALAPPSWPLPRPLQARIGGTNGYLAGRAELGGRRNSSGRTLMSSAERERRIRAIRDQVRRIVPLVYARLRHQDLEGTTRVRLSLTRHGYVDSVHVVSSSGHDLLDDEAGEVLHLGEPYAYVGGWLELDVVFDDTL